MTDRPEIPQTDALFVNDGEMHRRLAPHMGRDAFRATLKACERRDCRRIVALFRGRYWPACVVITAGIVPAMERSRL